MKRFLSLLFIFTLMFSLAACSGNNNSNEQQKENKNNEQAEKVENIELTISAAASLTDAFEEIKTKFEEENENIKLTFNFGASGDLQQQISQGAPVDFFISAALDKFETLQKEGAIDESNYKNFLLNELVLITPADSKLDINAFTDLTNDDVKQIAIGTPESVPVGKYTKQSFEHLGIWGELEDKIIYAKDVREVLHYVDTGNVDAGLVYRTDAATSDQSKIVAASEEGYHDPVIYPAGVLKDSKHHEEAIKFYEFLQGSTAVDILTKYGFIVLD